MPARTNAELRTAKQMRATIRIFSALMLREVATVTVVQSAFIIAWSVSSSLATRRDPAATSGCDDCIEFSTSVDIVCCCADQRRRRILLSDCNLVLNSMPTAPGIVSLILSCVAEKGTGGSEDETEWEDEDKFEGVCFGPGYAFGEVNGRLQSGHSTDRCSSHGTMHFL